MDHYVIRGNGEYAPFAPYKIEDALKKGFKSILKGYDPEIFSKIMTLLQVKTTWAVEEIQDLIEK